MPKIEAQIPDDIYRNIAEEINLGVFSGAPEAVVSALRKAYACKRRSLADEKMA
jgi:Arc/MetJ-type ribon-helix-helix transcriptional regulator